MNFTKRELELFCDACVRRGNFYMAAVACVALGPGYDWHFLPLSVDQAKAVQTLDDGLAYARVCEFAFEAMRYQ